jgi:mono/diheme cytochrome c family protein
MPPPTANPPPQHDPAANGAVEMPRPTAWPIVLALGITLAALGAATSLAFAAVGGVLVALGLIGWFSQLLSGGHEHEPLAPPAERPQPPVAQTGAVEQLKPGVVGYRFQVPEKVQPISAGIKGGIVGGLLMPIPALAWGVLSGHGIWFPVNLLSGMVVPGLGELSTAQLEAFHPWMFAGALVMHVLMSLGFGLVGGVLLPTLPSIPGGPMLFGGLILPLLWSGANHSLLAVVNPVLNHYIDWRWYVASQLVYGIATSIVILRSEKIQIAPRGPGGETGGPSIPPGWLGCLLAICLFISGCSDDFPGKPRAADAFVMPRNITDFKQLYSTRCAGCHGADGTLGPGPPLADPMFVALVGDDELHDVIANGRHGTLMPAWLDHSGGALTQQQVDILASGIKHGELVQNQSPKSDKSQNVYPSAPPLVPSTSEKEHDAAAGKKIFATACAGCHGDNGSGGDSGDVNNPAFLALVSNQILRRYIITGRSDLGMPNFAETTNRPPDFKPLTADDVGNLVALFSQWRSKLEP